MAFIGGQCFIEHKPFLLGICGPTCSGKTIVSNKISLKFKHLKNLVFSLDMYYKNLSGKINPLNYNFDNPKALDYPFILKNIKNLINKREIKKPIYDFKKHKRVGYEKIKGKFDLVIIEGIFVFYFKKLRNLLDFKIFLEVDEKEIYSRRIERDLKMRGSNIDFIKRQLEKFVFLGIEKYVIPYKKYSDLIIPSNIGLKEKINLISNEISKFLVK